MMHALSMTVRKVNVNRRVLKKLVPVRCLTATRLSSSSSSRRVVVKFSRLLKKHVQPLLHSGRVYATSAEEKANLRRWEESGGGQGSQDEWKWTLNWDDIDQNIVVGSCPRSVEDVDRIADETGATAMLSVQSDLCLDALQIDYNAIREHGLSRGILMTRVPIRDFDHEDQSLMLPEAVRTLALLLALNYRVYIHCTAGINRATLTVLGYLTFVQGSDLYTALEKIKTARPQANPYVDCWKTVKTRLLEGRQEEVVSLSRKFFLKNEGCTKADSFGNWLAAEDLVIKETFRRLLSSTINTISALTDLKVDSVCSICIHPQEIDKANREIEDLKYELNLQKTRLAEATEALEAQKLEHIQHEKESKSNVNGLKDFMSSTVYEELVDTKNELGELKKSIRKIAQVTTEALSMVSSRDSYDSDQQEENPEFDLNDIDDLEDEI